MGETKPPAGSDNLHTALNITKRCNQGCVFCFEGDRKGWDEPSFERVRAMLRASARKSSEVIFMGAEALLRRDILDIIRYARSLGLEVAAFSNGQAFSRKDFVWELADAGLAFSQVSAHYADAESFAQGTRTSPRLFDNFWRGLEHVAQHNRERPHRQLLVQPKTVLFRYNFMKLEAIEALLRQALGTSFRSYMIGGMFPAKSRTADYLLEPFAGRREELVSFLERWEPTREISFDLLPLCLVPGWEHYSFSVMHLADAVRVYCNFEDKSKLGPMHRYLDLYREDPYRWICRSCRLLAICAPFRTLWNCDSFYPTKQQEFMPVTDYGVEDVLARMAGKKTRARMRRRQERLRLHAQRCLEIPVPEYHLQQALLGCSHEDLKVDDIYCDHQPIFCVSMRCRGTPLSIRLGHPGTQQGIGFLVRYLNVVVEEPADVAPATLKAALRAIAALEIPPAKDWRGYPSYDPRFAGLSSSMWDVFGEDLWPGIGNVGGWPVRSVEAIENGGLRVRLPHPEGRDAFLWFHYPEYHPKELPDHCRAVLSDTSRFRVQLDVHNALWGREDEAAALAGLLRGIRRKLFGLRTRGAISRCLDPTGPADAWLLRDLKFQPHANAMSLQSMLTGLLMPGAGAAPRFAGYGATSIDIRTGEDAVLVWLTRRAQGSAAILDAFALKVWKADEPGGPGSGPAGGLAACPDGPAPTDSAKREAALEAFRRWLAAGPMPSSRSLRAASTPP
ncbi:MAG: radical SAM protein [Elusimicrobia bacterium]|nr:radical SAM protein [Elusimicrobiota bacterium]